MEIQEQTIATKTGNYRWTICTLLFLATTINYIDRQILSLVKPILDVELGWTNEEFGIVNAVFQGAYGFGLLFFGWFVDRYGAKVGYAVSIIGWSFAAMGHSLVSTVTGFMIARASLGVSEGGNFPSAIKATAQWFPKRERAYATSIFNAGTNVGAIAAPALVPWIAYTWGWQMAFIAAGVAGLLWLFLWIPLYDRPEKAKRLKAAERELIESDREEENEAQKISWLGLLRYRQTWSFIVAKFMTDPVWWFFLIWLPDYFKKTRDLDLKDSWVHLVTIYVIVTILSIFGGWVVGYLNKRGLSITRARKMSMFVFALCVIPIFLVEELGEWGAVFLIGLAGAAHQAWSANLYTTVSDMFPKKAIASVIGIGGMAGATGGMLFPVFSGRLLDNFTAAGNVTAGYTVLFTICAFAYVITFVFHHLLAPKFETFELK
ncbi:MAG TPA: MFS transporter [Chryseosolibacter sp.]|jgi:Sugar phosphate permease